MEIVNGERLVLGTCYYPEHWDESLWRDDLRRMLENGIEVIRIAEFAWSKIERYEGVFNYDFFDRFLDAAAEMGMKVIFCTPTATPPAWLTEKYPEVLNATMDGVLYRHGGRRHYNYNSPKYQELTRITKAIQDGDFFENEELVKAVEVKDLDTGQIIDLLTRHNVFEILLGCAHGVLVTIGVGDTQNLSVVAQENEIDAPSIDTD